MESGQQAKLCVAVVGGYLVGTVEASVPAGTVAVEQHRDWALVQVQVMVSIDCTEGLVLPLGSGEEVLRSVVNCHLEEDHRVPEVELHLVDEHQVPVTDPLH